MSTFSPKLQSVFGNVKPRVDSTQADPLAQSGLTDQAVDVTATASVEVRLPQKAGAHVAAPEKLAIVYAVPDGDSFRLQKYYGSAAGFRDSESSPECSLGKQTKLRILAGKVRAEDFTPEDVCSSAYNLSTEEPLRRLMDWLREVRAQEPRLNVLFVERTDLGIPWEMIYDDQDGLYLGEAVTITRVPSARLSMLSAGAPPIPCKGQIAFFAISDLPEPPTPDARQYLDKHLQRMRTASETPAFGELRQYLINARDDVGLIYLLCHGYVDEENVNSSWLGFKDEGDGKDKVVRRVFYRDLAPPPLKLLRKSRSLVLINACDAGTIRGKDPGLSNSTQLGFPERFLSLGASGVIGALAEVQVLHATRFAESLLEKARENPDTPIPELVRMIRQEAANRMRDEDDTSAWYYSFLYVYYGNPYATLKLEAKGPQP